MSRLSAWWREWGYSTFGLMLTVIAVAVIVWTCIVHTTSPSGSTDARFGLSETPIASYVITDDKTGVNYLIVEHNGIAITPLLSADGLPLMVDDLNHGDMETALKAARANLEVDR